jgi:hypothetical protein
MAVHARTGHANVEGGPQLPSHPILVLGERAGAELGEEGVEVHDPRV